MKKYDIIIVGTGFFGSVIAERVANDLSKNVLMIEQRKHIGGNCYSVFDKKSGIEYHKYGTHIFHTSNKNVMNYINNFAELNNYKHQVLSKYKKKIYQMPINLETINSIYNKCLSPSEAKIFLAQQIKKDKIKNIKNLEDKTISLVGKKIYNILIKGYTEKQWGKKCKDLPASIINRIPIRFNYNEDYFKNCNWQGIPKNGYTDLFTKMLKNNKIKIKFNKKFELKNFNPDIPVVYTGALDKLFNYKFGKLEWRSVNFDFKRIDSVDYQGNAVINYAERSINYTRIHEPRHLHPERKYGRNNIIIYEYPTINEKEPYYPINSEKNRILQKKYKNEVNKIKNLFVGGRLANYAYYDMDMTIAAALNFYNTVIKKKLNEKKKVYTAK
jgi:UDP-galactopyranose mutase